MTIQKLEPNCLLQVQLKQTLFKFKQTATNITDTITTLCIYITENKIAPGHTNIITSLTYLCCRMTLNVLQNCNSDIHFSSWVQLLPPLYGNTPFESLQNDMQSSVFSWRKIHYFWPKKMGNIGSFGITSIILTNFPDFSGAGTCKNFSPSQNWKKWTLVQSVQAVQANKHTSWPYV
jgi:hypothetical protein